MVKPSGVKVVFEPRDAWVGVFDNDTNVYVCLVPFIVIRYRGDPWYAAACLGVLAWLIAAVWMRASIPGWLVGVGVYLLVLSVLALALAARRSRRRVLSE